MDFRNFIGLAIILFFLVQLNANTTITGKVISLNEKNGIPGVNVYVKGNFKIGTSTNSNGEFVLELNQNAQALVFSSIGYHEFTYSLPDKELSNFKIDDIVLKPKTIDLKEIRILSSLADERKTPVSVSSVKAEDIEKKLGDQTYPETLKHIPGVYATRTGGGSGDARISIRGFKQENVALLYKRDPNRQR